MSQFSIVLHISISHVTISSLANGIHQSISFISRVKKVDWKMKNVSIKSTDQIDPWFFFVHAMKIKTGGRKWDYHASNSFYQFWMLFFIISWWMCSIFPRFGSYLPSVSYLEDWPFSLLMRKEGNSFDRILLGLALASCVDIISINFSLLRSAIIQQHAVA